MYSCPQVLGRLCLARKGKQLIGELFYHIWSNLIEDYLDSREVVLLMGVGLLLKRLVSLPINAFASLDGSFSTYLNLLDFLHSKQSRSLSVFSLCTLPQAFFNAVSNKED